MGAQSSEADSQSDGTLALAATKIILAKVSTLPQFATERAACTTRQNKRSDFRCGSWLCENAKTLERNRRSYSSKIVLELKLASGVNFNDKLRNAILAAFRSFAF